LTTHGDFAYISDAARTMPQLLKGFEPRTNTYDKALVYFLTGLEEDSCMKFWHEDVDFLFTFAESQDEDGLINLSL